MARDQVKNRANVARHRRRRRERVNAAMAEVVGYVQRTPVEDDDGQQVGYMIRLELPPDALERFEALALEHGRTLDQLMREIVEVYGEEIQRLRDERN